MEAPVTHTRMFALASALALFALSGCTRDKYPWPDFRVDESAWRPLAPAPVVPAPSVQWGIVPAVAGR